MVDHTGDYMFWGIVALIAVGFVISLIQQIRRK